MNINLNRKGIMALEGLEEETPVDPAFDPETSVSSGLLENQEITNEADDQIDQIAEAEETSEALNGIAAHIEETLPEGGLSEPVAAALTAAVEHMCQRLGFTKQVMPAMESFGEKSRVHYTKVALESATDAVKNVLKAIAAAFKRLYEWVKGLFKNIFSTKKNIDAQTDALEKQLTKIQPLDKEKESKATVTGTWTTALFNSKSAESDLNSGYVVKHFKEFTEKSFGGQFTSAADKIVKAMEFCSTQDMGFDAHVEQKQQVIKGLSTLVEDAATNPAVGRNSFGVYELLVPEVVKGEGGYENFKTGSSNLKKIDQGKDGDALKQIQLATIEHMNALVKINKAFGNNSAYYGKIEIIEKSMGELDETITGMTDHKGPVDFDIQLTIGYLKQCRTTFYTTLSFFNNVERLKTIYRQSVNEYVSMSMKAHGATKVA